MNKAYNTEQHNKMWENTTNRVKHIYGITHADIVNKMYTSLPKVRIQYNTINTVVWHISVLYSKYHIYTSLTLVNSNSLYTPHPPVYRPEPTELWRTENCLNMIGYLYIIHIRYFYISAYIVVINIILYKCIIYCIL